MSKYARNPAYGAPPNWRKIYRAHSPERTDEYSRHAKVIAEVLRTPRSSARRALIDAGYEPDHWAASIERTVEMLWEARRYLEWRDGSWQLRPELAVPPRARAGAKKKSRP